MTNFLNQHSRKVRHIQAGILYGLLLAAAYWLAWEVRFDFSVPDSMQDNRAATLMPLLSTKLVILLLLRQFGTMLAYFSLPDLVRIVAAMTASSTLAYLSGVVLQRSLLTMPRGVLLMDLVLSVAALCTLRLALRIYREKYQDRPVSNDAIPGMLRRVAIIGAGDVGANLARELNSHRSLGLAPVVFLDDDFRKHGGFVHGIPVEGPIDDVALIRERHDFAQVILALPSATEKRLREIIELMAARGLKADIVPSMRDLASGRLTVSRIRPVDVEDLLGRDTATLDTEGIREMVSGRVVMVTGAGGSIGSELCRQIAACKPTRLLLLEQSEAALFVIEQELVNAGTGAIIQPLVADILDRPRLRQIFARHQPHAVFHAAAHKHVFLMERQPAEALKNNSVGTLILAQEAVAHQVERFVFISTDKAINPTNVMGASKRLAELLMRQLHVGGKAGNTRLMAVRFGNVLGSSGSVVPIFKQQIARGGPVTVTHPEVTRYFMTIPEAVGLVLQASLLGQGGEIFVLDMGRPMKIADLARQMIRLSGFQPDVDIEITFTGLKAGEKLYEELRHHTESHQATTHPQIMKFIASEGELKGLETEILQVLPELHGMDPNDIKRWLQKHIAEYTPCLD
jgi:FlaA1/EpsC-like NDP-sugar epimerase